MIVTDRSMKSTHLCWTVRPSDLDVVNELICSADWAATGLRHHNRIESINADLRHAIPAQTSDKRRNYLQQYVLCYVGVVPKNG